MDEVSFGELGQYQRVQLVLTVTNYSHPRAMVNIPTSRRVTVHANGIGSQRYRGHPQAFELL